MKLGAENRKKVIFTVILAVVAVVLFVNMVVSGNGPAPASGSSAAAIQPAATPVATESRRAAHKAAVKSRVSNDLDPSLRTDLLQASEDVAYNGSGRNPFRAEPDPPTLDKIKPICAQPGGPSHGLRWCSPLIVREAPPPPPIELKFFGFASRVGEPKKVFLSSHDGDVFIAKEGDIVDRRYRIVQIKASSVMIEDVLNKNTQEIFLTQATTGSS